MLSLAHGNVFPSVGLETVVREVLGPSYVSALAARAEREFAAYFPSAGCAAGIFGDCLVSMPLAVYGGICADDPNAYSRLLKAGTELGASG